MKHQDCESYNVFVDLPANASRKFNAMMNSNSNKNWNDKVEAPLHRLDYEGFFSILDNNSRADRFFCFREVR